MHESGLKTIEDSKSNGLWNFMDDVDNLVVPEDLSQELSKLEGAAEFFNSINPSSKRFVLRWIKLAKTDKTRKNRIKKITELSSKGENCREVKKEKTLANNTYGGNENKTLGR